MKLTLDNLPARGGFEQRWTRAGDVEERNIESWFLRSSNTVPAALRFDRNPESTIVVGALTLMERELGPEEDPVPPPEEDPVPPPKKDKPDHNPPGHDDEDEEEEEEEL